MGKRIYLGLAVATLSAFGLSNVASAVILSGTLASDPTHYAASADFTLAAGILTITLTNTATATTQNNLQLLEGVYWAKGATTKGTGFDVALGPASSIQPGAGNIGVFGYGTGDVGALTVPQSGNVDLSNYWGVTGSAFAFNTSSGVFDTIAQGGVTPNPDNSPNGPNGGLTSASTTDFSGLGSNGSVIRNALTYTINVTGTGFVLPSEVFFTYGTGPGIVFGGSGGGTPPPPPVPLPAAVWSGMALLAGMGAVGKWRKRNA